MMKKPIILFFVCSCFNLTIMCSVSFAQLYKIDSLKEIIIKVNNDTDKVFLLNKLSRQYKMINQFDSSIHYAKIALLLAQKISFNRGYIQSFTNLGTIYQQKGNFLKAYEYFFAGLKVAEKINNKKEISTYYFLLGGLFAAQNNYDKALDYFHNTLQLLKELGDKKRMATIYRQIGNCYVEKHEYALALENQQLSIKIAKEINDNLCVGLSYNEIGIINKELKNYDEALKYYFLAIETLEDENEKYGLAATYGNIGGIYLYKKNYTQAIYYTSKSLKGLMELGLKDGIILAHKSLANIYLTIDDYKNAYKHHLLYAQVKDSLFNENSSKQITEMQTKYETEKKEQQIKLLNKDKEIQIKDLARQKTIRNAVAGGFILVLLFSFLLINRFIFIRKQKKVIETEREKSEKLLLNILPMETAEELKLTGKALPKYYEQVTVMFTDFKGFTQIAEKMSAEELVSELDFIFKKFDEIISKYPIEKIKTIGDSYMCAGGVPVANTTNPVDLVMAGLEICEWMKGRAGEGEKGGKGESEKGGWGEKMNLKKEEPENKQRGEYESESRLPFSPSSFPLFQVRIGIHTGSIIAGVVGDKKFAYDIWGDTVNTASRMESSGVAGKVNISGETYKLLIDSKNILPLQFTFRGEIEAKNKGKIEMYFVENSIPYPRQRGI